MQIEIFYTSIDNPESACTARRRIESAFPGYRVNFDLADCDRVMRVVTARGRIAIDQLITLLREEGITAGILPDIIPSPKVYNCFNC